MRATFGLGLAGLAAIALPSQAEHHVLRYHADHVLGTSLDMAVVAEHPLAAALAIDAARSEITRLDAILSAWRPDSELMILNAAQEHRASPDLFAVIAACEDWRRKSFGAFSGRLGRLLTACGSPALAAHTDSAALLLDPTTGVIGRPEPIQFAVDGLAKGYVIDRALEAARCQPGVLGVMLDIGGDLRCWGKAPQTAGWRIAVVDAADPSDNASPMSHVILNDLAAATSGRSSRGQTILSPSDGAAVTHIAYATAVAKTAMDADALATIFSVLPPQQSLALADRLPDVAAHIQSADGSVHTSSRWRGLCAEPSPLRVAQAGNPSAGPAPATGPEWPRGFSLAIDYELPQIATNSYHSPVVAIWVTDEDKKPVRSLLILGYQNRYREEVYIYWRRVGRLDLDLADSITKPTRPPGRYSIKWDGLDDSGKKVPQGKYILNIEASREKGGHSVQRLELTLGANGAVFDAAPAEEMGKVRATYGKGA